MTTSVDQLRDQVGGEVVTPGDAAYEEARKVHNAMIDRRPRVVVRCAGVEDVVAAVNVARESGTDLAVRGGSHSVPGFGTADDAVVIDLSGIRGVDVDAEAMTARAQGGATRVAAGENSAPPGSQSRRAGAGLRSSSTTKGGARGSRFRGLTALQPVRHTAGEPILDLTLRVVAAELAHGVVESLGPFEVADVTGAGDHDEPGIRDRLLELAGDAERRPRVELAPDQQRRYGDARQEVALVDRGHHEQLCPEALRAHVSSHRLEQRHKFGPRVGGEQPGEGGIELLAGR